MAHQAAYGGEALTPIPGAFVSRDSVNRPRAAFGPRRTAPGGPSGP